jgi:hypothetical protein
MACSSALRCIRLPSDRPQTNFRSRPLWFATKGKRRRKGRIIVAWWTVDRRDRLVVLAWVLILAGVLLRPVTGAGYLLAHDVVFTPNQPLNLSAIGLSGAATRAVPLDALVAAAGHVLGGAVLGRLALVIPLVGAGLGAARLLDGAGLPARLAAAGFAIWNPFVVERLALGQWALLWAYAGMPWLVRAVRAGSWPLVALTLAAGAITPTGGLIVGAVAVATAAASRWHTGRVAALAAILQLPWVLPSVLSAAATTSDPAGVAAFAARAEHPGGVLLTLLGGGGIWDVDVVPGSRAGALAWLGLAVLVAAAWYGVARLAALLGGRVLVALGTVAAVGLLIACAPALPGGAAVMRAVTGHVPGGGLLRDSQKWILPLVALEAWLIGAATDRLARHARTVAGLGFAIVLLALSAPLLLLPDAAATLKPTLSPVRYPADWQPVIAAARGGDAVVLPFQAYRRFGWTRGLSTLDPAPRLLHTPVIASDQLAVSGHLLAGEDPRAARIAALLTETDWVAALAKAGVHWVVVEGQTPGTVPDLTGLVPVHVGDQVSLYRVPDAVASPHPSDARIGLVVGADLAVAGTVLAVVLAGWFGALRQRSARKRSEGP